MTLYSVLANTICVSFTFIYVAGFYLFRQQGPALSRNHPEVILSRLKAVALASIVIPAIVHVILPSVPLTLALGILPLKISLLTPLLLTIILFCGPLALMYFDEELPWQKHFDLQQELRMITSLLGQRNFIVAPVTEEFVFRACVICVLYHSGFSTAYLIFVSPMYFGLAHLHHAWENYHQWGANAKALKLAVSSSAFQFAYTTMFGWYVSFIFLRAGSIWPPILCHAFCNMMGFPDVSDIKQRPPIHQKIIWSCFVGGFILFWYLLYPLTNPALFDGSMYWSA